MKNFIVSSWGAVMDNRRNPLSHLDLASQHYTMQVLAWMWSMVFSLSFLSVVAFGYVWLGHLLVIAGVFITISLFKASESRHHKSAPAPYLSRASKTVWQMDREA